MFKANVISPSSEFKGYKILTKILKRYIKFILIKMAKSLHQQRLTPSEKAKSLPRSDFAKCEFF